MLVIIAILSLLLGYVSFKYLKLYRRKNIKITVEEFDTMNEKEFTDLVLGERKDDISERFEVVSESEQWLVYANEDSQAHDMAFAIDMYDPRTMYGSCFKESYRRHGKSAIVPIGNDGHIFWIGAN